MLESRPEDALVLLVKLVKSDCTANFTAHSTCTARNACTAHNARTARTAHW